ncbi:MAG: DUF2490 domain-containing protein [Chitinophagales bacterium]
MCFLQRFLLTGLIFFCCEFYINAQDGDDAGYSNYHNDFQSWFSVKLNKDFKKGVSINGQYLLRVDVSNQTVNGHYFYAGLKYKILKYLYADFQFRGVNTPQKNLYRFEFGLKARYKKKDWTVGYRMGYFHENEYFARSYERGHAPTNYWRNRIEARFDFKKHWGTYASVEAYTLCTNRGLFLRRVAFIAGFDYNFKKDHTISLYYVAQPDFSQKNLDVVHALALTYSWDIPNKLFKKKKGKKK